MLENNGRLCIIVPESVYSKGAVPIYIIRYRKRNEK